jgi:hypothetical protein
MLRAELFALIAMKIATAAKTTPRTLAAAGFQLSRSNCPTGW